MTGLRDRWRRRHHDQHGTTMIFIVGLVVVLLMAIAVAVDGSAAFLRRQSLDNLADGAALAGADAGAAGWKLYGTGLDEEQVALVKQAATAGVDDYLAGIDAYRTYPGLGRDIAVVDGAVRVTIHAPMTLPLTFPGVDPGIRVHATGSATVTTG